MSWFCKYANSSIGKKHFMGISGLLLCGFLFFHALGNALMWVSPEMFNSYSYKLVHNAFIIPMEIGLFLLFLFHIGMGVRLTLENRKARPQKYALKTRTGRGSTIASSTMIYTGITVFIFLIVHLKTIKWGANYTATYAGVEMRDLFRLVVEKFQSLPYTSFYVVAMLAIGVHLSHGFASAFKSLGIFHEKYNCTIEFIGKVYAVFVAAVFIGLSLWAFFKGV